MLKGWWKHKVVQEQREKAGVKSFVALILVLCSHRNPQKTLGNEERHGKEVVIQATRSRPGEEGR